MLRGTHDNWEKLVGAVLKKEELRRIAYCESLSSSISADFSSRFSFDSVSFAVLKKEELRRIAYCEGLSSSISADFSSRFSFDSVSFAASEFYGKTLDPASTSGHHGAQPIKFKELKKATENFNHEMWLGRGAFGHVFKGWIDEHTLCASKSGSGMAVAVKKWRKGIIQHEEYLKEINYLSQHRHPNLVKLIGYCSEGDDLILVYELMPKGSLNNHLFRGGHQSLSWETRMKVAIGAAKALSFLHNMATPVIHRGCQCSNILLDGEFNAKLSDFSFARYGASGRMTHVSAGNAGSSVVIAAEYGQITEKSDVYSFGNILLELLSGSPALVLMWPVEDQLEWGKRYVGDESNLSRIIDTRLEGRYPHDEAYIVAKLACQCLSKKLNKRPRMAEVVVALQQLERP